MKLQNYIFILFLSIQISFSQTHIYEHFGVDEGLPSSEVYDVYQDKQGYIWFATDKGLSRFNGYEFKNFTTKDGLPDNTILDFYPQENRQVWFYGYHSQSLFYFNDEFDGFKAYAYNDRLKKQLGFNSIIKSVVIDKDSSVNIGGFGFCGLVKINNEGDVSVHYEKDSLIDESYENQEFHLGLETKKIFSFLHAMTISLKNMYLFLILKANQLLGSILHF